GSDAAGAGGIRTLRAIPAGRALAQPTATEPLADELRDALRTLAGEAAGAAHAAVGLGTCRAVALIHATEREEALSLSGVFNALPVAHAAGAGGSSTIVAARAWAQPTATEPLADELRDAGRTLAGEAAGAAHAAVGLGTCRAVTLI